MNGPSLVFSLTPQSVTKEKNALLNFCMVIYVQSTVANSLVTFNSRRNTMMMKCDHYITPIL